MTRRPAGFSEATGHFTQVVWARTSSVGCGIKFCATQVATVAAIAHCRGTANAHWFKSLILSSVTVKLVSSYTPTLASHAYLNTMSLICGSVHSLMHDTQPASLRFM